jgi:ADP-ribose pyrophosphatase YjhB (NUDIX family)
LLKRDKPPYIWGPPGGRLRRNEHPEHGLIREIYEETGLQVIITQPVTTWFGKFHNEYLLSIDYLCINPTGTVCLSVEHKAYDWVSISDLGAYLTPKEGFQFEDFKRALQIYQLYNQQCK